MKAYERKLAAELLRMAADQFGNHGCNDLDLREYGITKAQAWELVRGYHLWNGDPEEAERNDDSFIHIALGDFQLMNWLAVKLELGGDE